MLEAARRFAGLLAVIAGIVVALSLLAALALGSSPGRAVPTGLYAVGAFLVLAGVLSGVRGPMRPKRNEDERDAVGGLFGLSALARGARAATADERQDARSTTWLFLMLGLGLIVLGVLADGRTSLVR